MKKEVALIGFGYWGKILYKNLKSMGYKVVICENSVIDYNEVLTEDRDSIEIDYKNIDNDIIFITTPTKTHYEICKYFIKKDKKIFCEKPLTENQEKTKELYELSKNHKGNLYVDWIFIKNEGVNIIKKIINSGELGVLKSINMRRLNKGPIRYDVDAKLDLSVHDISIITHILGYNVENFTSIDFKRNIKSKRNDSNITTFLNNGVTCFIETSWEYPIKDRLCIFEFDSGVVLWDDTKQVVSKNGSDIKYNKSPLITSITDFIDGDKNEKMTIFINELYGNTI